MPSTPPNACRTTDEPLDRPRTEPAGSADDPNTESHSNATVTSNPESHPNATAPSNPGPGDATVRESIPDLPELEPGITLLETEESGPLRSLVVDHLLGTDGPAVWVDAGGVARTTALLRLAPSRRALDRIRVARGFTAFQHRALLDRLRSVVDDRTVLAVVPRIDRPYRADDCGAEEGERLLVDGIAALAAAVREHDLPALVTRGAADATSAPVVNAADRTIAVEDTRFGPRFVGDDVETLVYPGDGYVQTTLAFWRRVLAARHGVTPGVAAPDGPGGETRTAPRRPVRVDGAGRPPVGGRATAADGSQW